MPDQSGWNVVSSRPDGPPPSAPASGWNVVTSVPDAPTTEINAPTQPTQTPATRTIAPPQPGGLIEPNAAVALTTHIAQATAQHIMQPQTIGATPAPSFLERLAAPFTGPGSAYGNIQAQREGGQAPYNPDAPLIDFGANAKQITGGPVNRGATTALQDALSGLTTPKSIALLLATGGLAGPGKLAELSEPAIGKLAVAGAKYMPRIKTLVSAGFSMDMIRSALEQSPQLIKQIKSGDIEGATHTLTSMGVGFAMGTAAGLHARSEFQGRPKTGPPAPDEPQYTSTGQPVGGVSSPAPAQPGQPAQPVQRGAAPAAPKLSDAALSELLKTESGPKRLDLILQARSRGIPIPDVAPRAEQAGAALSNLAHYHYLFDEADRRMEAAVKQKAKVAAKGQRQKPVVPVEGPSAWVARVMYARENLAEQFGKPWKELSNSERLTIDSLISEGYGHAMPPKQAGSPATPADEPPAPRVKTAAAPKAKTPEPWEVVKSEPLEPETPKPEPKTESAKLTAAEGDVYKQAVALVREAGKASTSMLQRKLRLRFDAVTEMLDRMEAEGIIGPADGSKPREVLTPGQPPAAPEPPKKEPKEPPHETVTTPPVKEAEPAREPERGGRKPTAVETPARETKVEPDSISVPASRFADDTGDIRESYSADTIGAKGTIRQTFTHDGKTWVTVSTAGSSDGVQRAGAYQVVPPSEAPALPAGYRPSGDNPEGYYHGQKVKLGGKPFVLVGPKRTFVGDAPESEPAQKPAQPPAQPRAAKVETPAPAPKVTKARLQKIRDIRKETGMNYADATRELDKREAAQPVAADAAAPTSGRRTGVPGNPKADETPSTLGDGSTMAGPSVARTIDVRNAHATERQAPPPGGSGSSVTAAAAPALPLTKAERAKAIRDLRASGMTYKAAVAQVDGGAAQPHAAMPAGVLDRLTEAGKESEQWLRENGILGGESLSANRILDPEVFFHLTRSVAGDVARGVISVRDAAQRIIDRIRGKFDDVPALAVIEARIREHVRAAAPGARESGERGPVFREFRHDEAGATEALEKEQGGEAIGALEDRKFGHGDVDLVWGYEGDGAPEWARGYGLAHILAKHPHMRGRLQTMLNRMTRAKPQGERVMLSNEQGEHATLALTWFGRENKTWLLTEYDQREPASENILFGSGNPVAGASKPNSPLAGDSGSSVTPGPAGETPPAAAGPIESRGAEEPAAALADTGRLQPGGEGSPVPQSRPPAHEVVIGKETEVYAEGREQPYRARYVVRELDDTYPSHNPLTFEPNLDFHFINDRDYKLPANKNRVINNSGPRFRPVRVINNNPDAINGPSVIDADGNVLGGNNRRMSLERVYALNPAGAKAYRALLEKEAPQFELDPAAIARMKRPGLFRELIDPVDPQRAITEFNQDPAAELSIGEQAAADARGLSPEVGKYLAAMMDSFGPDATLTDILNSARGGDIVNYLIKSNLFTETERPLLLDAKTGAVTSEAKQRIAKMLLGGLFKDSRDFQDSPPSLRNKLERVAPILKALEGRGEWNLTPDVKQALEMMSFERDYGRAFGIKPGESFLIKNAKSEAAGQREYQGGIFDEPGEQPKIPEISERARRIGVFISQNSPRAITAAFRDFAEKSNEKSLFGEPNPDESFAAAFGDPRSSPEAGMTSREFLDFLTFGLPKFLEQDVAPVLRSVATGLRDGYGDIMKAVAPTLYDRAGKKAGLSLRGKLGEFARKMAQARHATEEAEKFFDRQPAADNYEFIDRMEHGQKQATPELDAIAGTLRRLLDEAKTQVQALGTGKLQSFYQNYFPHIWKDPNAAKSVFGAFFARRPLEGKKAFLKKRTMPTFRDGLDADLEPVSDNPVSLTLLKLQEMGKYVAAHELLKDWKKDGTARYFDARGKAPRGLVKIDDPIGTVYGQSIQQIAEYPNEGIYTGLEKAAAALGVTHKRGFLKGMGQAIGRAYKAGGRVQTVHGTKEGTLAHEIGHQIDWLAGSGQRLVLEYPDAATVGRLKRAYATLKDKGSTPGDRTAARLELKSLKGAIAQRKEFAQQLRDLADLRDGPQAYVRSREEKMAQLAQMWVEGRDLFKRTAPKVFAEWKQFLNENPKLHALRDIEAGANATMLAQPYDVGGLVVKGHYYAPDGAARILNQYLSPGLNRYGLFRAAMGLNGVMNLFNLGLSGFHVTKTGFESVLSRGAIGAEQIARGAPLRGAMNIATAPAAPFTNYMRGIKALREYYEPGTQGAEIGNIVDRLTTGGARGRMDDMQRTTIAESMTRAFHRGNVLGAGLRLPFAAMELPTRIILDKIVPAVKWGTMADMLRADLERLGPNANDADIRRVAAETVNAVDNRMGEVARDNFFTHRYLKDLSMFLMRADQYTLGTAREIGGAGIDVVRQPLNALRGEPVNLKRLSYVASMFGFHMAYSALYQYLHTGKWPQEGEDYFYPRNGGIDERGNPQRTSLWSYIKDIHSFARNWKQTAQNKIAPSIEMVSALVRNRDFWNVEIRHPDDPVAEQLKQTGKFVAREFLPRSVEQFQRERTLGTDPETQAEQFFGLSPAPSDLDLGPAERLARGIVGDRSPGEARTAESAARHDLKVQLTRSLRNNKGIPKEVIEARRNGTLSTRDVAEAVRAAKETPLQAAFVRLSVDEALRVYRHASPAEKRQIQALLVRKAQAAIASEPPSARAKTRTDLRAALAGR
jgi:hypothetical protein